MLDPMPGFLHEDEAARRIALAVSGGNLSMTGACEGRVNLSADIHGLLVVDAEALLTVNSLGEIALASLHTLQEVQARQLVAGTRIIPLVIEEEKIRRVEECSAGKAVIRVAPFRSCRVGVVTTGSEVYHGRIKDAFGPVLREKFSRLGSAVLDQRVTSDDVDMTANAIRDLLAEGADMIAVTGGMSVDPDDRTPAAIRAAGGRQVVYGSPTFPGAMFLLAYIGDVPVLGLPAASCTTGQHLRPDRSPASGGNFGHRPGRRGPGARRFLRLLPRVPLPGVSVRQGMTPSGPRAGGDTASATMPRRQHMIQKELIVNGVKRSLVVSADATLADVLREQLLLTGVKIGCGQGQCGACSVILDGKVVRSCITKVKRVPDGANVTTIEGVGTPDAPHALQLAWMVHGAAQCGFCSPGFIVSAKGLLDENKKPTREEVRDWFQKHKNACRCTGYKPLVDAVMDAAKVLRGEMSAADLAYKLPADGRAFGSKLPRPSALAKVTGTCDYGADLAHKMPKDTLHLALVQSPVSHATIKGIDASEALAMPGVHSVLTHKDVKGKNRITGLITFPTNKGDGWDRPILCDTKVFQYGDAVAIVCADSEKRARAAAEKVKVEYEELPAYMSAPAAMAEDAIEIHPGTPNVYYIQKIAKGPDTAPIFEKADVVAEDDFYVGRQPHMPIEPDVGFAYINDEGKLVIHSKSIGLHLHLYMIAPGMGIEPENVVMVQNPTGGTFGYKSARPWRPWWAWPPWPRGVPCTCATTTSSRCTTRASAPRSS